MWQTEGEESPPGRRKGLSSRDMWQTEGEESPPGRRKGLSSRDMWQIRGEESPPSRKKGLNSRDKEENVGGLCPLSYRKDKKRRKVSQSSQTESPTKRKKLKSGWKQCDRKEYIVKKISTMLKEEANDLEEIINRAHVRMKKAPQGNLRISGKKRGTEYYLKKDGEKGNGRYISKKYISMIEKLAQKDYDVQLIKLAEERLKIIRNFLKRYEETDLQELYAGLNYHRKELLAEAVLSEEEYVRRWEAVEYEGKEFAEDAPEIVTEKKQIKK